MTKEKSDKRTLKISEIKDGMVIEAYTGFDEKYTNMDEKACQFVRHNFRNARASVERNSVVQEIPVEALKVSDTLKRLYNFPPDLKKIVVVNERLTKALKSRGFTEFLVKESELEADEKEELKHAIDLVKKATLTPSEKKEKKKRAKEKANKFVQQLKENVSTRKKTSQAIENIMDNARKGNVNHDDITEYVEQITKNASAEAMSAIVSLKQSDQTYDHCVDVGVIFQSNYFRILEAKGQKSVFDSKDQALLGSFLHDFGKSKIPKDILDSTVRFERESREMKLMESHPKFGADLLSGMNMPSSIINMAHFHHVKQDTTMNSCYPKGVDYSKVTYESRLLAIIDAYQALVGRRKYKKSWNPPAAIRYIDALAGVEFDVEAWDDFLKVMGLYPKGSLVELSNKSIGFVMNTPKEDLSRPQVAVLRNSAGEHMEHHELIDLEDEQEIEIVKDLDIEQTFGSDAIHIFTSIQIV